jgi:hypothetical protein
VSGQQELPSDQPGQQEQWKHRHQLDRGLARLTLER